MGFVPLFVVLFGLVFLAITLYYHTFKGYKKVILSLISGIQESKTKIRSDVDQLESLSVPELEGFCENMCGYLSGRLENNSLEQKMGQVNEAFSRMYSETESKHLQEEILKSINWEVKRIANLNAELKDNQYAYDKLREEKPYSMLAKMMHFGPVQAPWETANTASSIPS